MPGLWCGRGQGWWRGAKGGGRPAQVVALNPGEKGRIGELAWFSGGNPALVPGGGVGFFRGDESRTDISEVGADRLGGEDGAAGSDGARQDQRPLEPGPDLLHQGEEIGRAHV